MTSTTLDPHGVALPAGSEVRLWLGSANRDPRVLSDRDAFVVGWSGLRDGVRRSAAVADLRRRVDGPPRSLPSLPVAW